MQKALVFLTLSSLRMSSCTAGARSKQVIFLFRCRASWMISFESCAKLCRHKTSSNDASKERDGNSGGE